MIETAIIIRCDDGYPGEEQSDWWVDSVKSLETRLSDEGWIKRGKNLHYCPLHADDHR